MSASRWQPDGWDAAVRIGLLVPHADVGPESEFAAMAPPEVAIHAARVPFGAMAQGGGMDPTIPLAPVRAFAEPPHVDEATELLVAAPVHVVAFGFTSSAYVIGFAEEEAMIERLEGRSRGVPVVTPCRSAIEALRTLAVKRIALFDPPWFDDDLSARGRRYFEAGGCAVVRSGPCRLPSAQAAITPGALHEEVVPQVPDDAEAVVIGGNGFRAVGAIAPLEESLGRPVLTANQALLWGALRAAGAPTSSVNGYGRVFAA
jgi:maleate isomerase